MTRRIATIGRFDGGMAVATLGRFAVTTDSGVRFELINPVGSAEGLKAVAIVIKL